MIDAIVSTDDILPARYKHAAVEPSEFAAHLFENVRPDFARTVARGDVLVGTRLFGIGSSREQAVSALKAAGVAAVIAPAFGRIFYRNAWNLALPALQVQSFAPAEGDAIAIDLARGILVHRGGCVPFAPVPIEILQMMSLGGLLRHIRQQGYGHGA